MFRVRFLLGTFLILVFSLSVSSQVFAIPTPQEWTGIYTIKSSVPFVWVRATPSSYGQVIATLYTPSALLASVSGSGDPFKWDGVQWWGFVNLPMTTTMGWVEVASLEKAAASTGTPTATPTAHEAWSSTSVVRVKANIMFVWLRAAPNSYAGALTSVGATTALKVVNDNPTFDGYQWWWQVKNPGNAITGWSEQQSLELAPGVVPSEPPKPAPQPWGVGAQVRVKLNISFSWLRSTASSWAAVNYVANTGQMLTVTAAPQYDGFQWWWPVAIPNTQLAGWVEQDSLDYMVGPSSNAATPTPTPQIGQLNVHQEQGAYQAYQHGFMIWDSSDQTIYVLYDNKQWDEYTIPNYNNLPDNPVPDAPPAGLIKPIRGFGRVWGNFHQVRETLGWATGEEQSFTLTVKIPNNTFHFFYLSLPNSQSLYLEREATYSVWSITNN